MEYITRRHAHRSGFWEGMLIMAGLCLALWAGNFVIDQAQGAPASCGRPQ